jgi:hypothetical protein
MAVGYAEGGFLHLSSLLLEIFAPHSKGLYIRTPKQIIYKAR